MKEKLLAEINKIREMDTEHKISYFKTYYLKWTCVALFLVLCLIWFLLDAFSSANIAYAGGECMVTVTDEGKKALTQDFASFIGLKNEDSVYLSEDLILSYAEGDEYNNQSTDVALYTYMVAGDYQYMLMDESVAEHIATMDAFINIESLAKKCELPLSDAIYRSNELGEAVPVAVKLPATICDKYGIKGVTGDVYLAFVYMKKDTGLNESFLQYLTL